MICKNCGHEKHEHYECESFCQVGYKDDCGKYYRTCECNKFEPEKEAKKE